MVNIIKRNIGIIIIWGGTAASVVVPVVIETLLS